MKSKLGLLAMGSILTWLFLSSPSFGWERRCVNSSFFYLGKRSLYSDKVFESLPIALRGPGFGLRGRGSCFWNSSRSEYWRLEQRIRRIEQQLNDVEFKNLFEK